ncbi:MAG TPA: OmpA family protein [Ignavibacteriaceae bacterium]|jgi:outer membrane protein OmpA-like peptidoglycan-associated protein|nr:MAG: Peptidoglycan-binding protein ArfA [Ignavibacteria bacterium ADurb.Bin266]OQY71542.1 MAG: hypothetical protein B6D44_12535 [Ignavibacteriales bacterium UTCHB2]HQF42391.1 OmpA family protein [Ignavibacteriaceae bacterium]HQI39735.1 OmpA family protein [Ignavibacteriaceae bacterium]
MNRFIILLHIVVLTFSYTNNINSQTLSSENEFLKQNFIATVNGGISYGFTDYKNSSLGLAAKTSLDYYPLIIQDARLGFKIFGGGLNLKFNDPRSSVSSNDGPREIPKNIRTDMIFLGVGLNFGYAINDYIIPSIMIGGTYLNFSPKSEDGSILEFNQLNRYDKSVFTFAIEGNINFKISDRFSINASLSYHPTSIDYLEDLSAANNSDSYLTAMVGISYAITGISDYKKDNIQEVPDIVPEQPKDITIIPKEEEKQPELSGEKDSLLNVDENKPLDEKEPVIENKEVEPEVTQEQETFYQFNLRGEDLFINSSSNLKEGAKVILNEIAFYIQNQPKSKWRIEGHMDSQGSAYTIKKLSYDRAKAVYEYLVSQGASQDQMEVYGLGDSFPVGNNNTAEGRKANRRIMIIREN